MNRWDFELFHIPGRDNDTSDGLSRKLDEMTDDDFDHYLSLLHIDNMKQSAPTDAQANAWRCDPEGLDLLDDVADAELPADFHSVVAEAIHELECRHRKPTPVHQLAPSSQAVAQFNHAMNRAYSHVECAQAVPTGSLDASAAVAPPLPLEQPEWFDQ